MRHRARFEPNRSFWQAVSVLLVRLSLIVFGTLPLDAGTWRAFGVFALALAAACAGELSEGELRTARQAHVNCFEFDESGNPPVGDDDEDGFCNDEDNCPLIANDQSEDDDGDGRGNRCDACFGEDTAGDGDLDGFCADTDCDDRNKDVYPGADEICDGLVNACGGELPLDELDDDEDSVPNCADACEGRDAFGDRDRDGLCNDIDPCVGPENIDGDGDGVCDSLDQCDGDDASGDADRDGVCDDIDRCDGDDASGDADEDGLCDDSDPCFGIGPEDADLDGVCDDEDLCEGDDAEGDGDEDGWCADLDCDDERSADSPAGVEVCDGRDNDCSSVADDGDLCPADQACAEGVCTPLQPCYRDVDGDGFAGPSDVVLFPPGTECATQGRYPSVTDCDDDPGACGAACSPANEEACDALDRDCDGDPRNDPDALCDDPLGGVALCTPAGCAATCDSGWTANGARCDDVDECALDAAERGCDERATCENQDGSYACACPDGTQDVGAAAGEACESVCGDGVALADEGCDDGNRAADDGCDAACAVEEGWRCDPTCRAICGDGLLRGGEACDDANDEPGDGCLGCEVEPDWACEGEPSGCSRTAICGNGVIEGGEECDDGGLFDEDGCGRDCRVEDGFSCNGEPSECIEEGRAPDAGAQADAASDAGVDAGADPAGGGGCAHVPRAPAPLAIVLVVAAACLLRRETPRHRS